MTDQVTMLAQNPRGNAALAVLRRLAPLVAVIAVTGAACDDTADESTPEDPCVASVGRASRANEIAEQITLLDEAIVACPSITALDAQLSQFPGLIGYDTETFTARRCATSEDEVLLSSQLCTAVVNVPTAVTTPPVPEVVYVGTTLDGRSVEIRPDEHTTFVDGKPEPIVTIVDIANEDGCEGVEAERDAWAAQVDDPVIGDRASVFAQHAENVLAYIECD